MVPEVTIMPVSFQKITLTTELPGRTSAFRMAEIRPQVNGLLLKRLFTEGQDVRAGDILYQIDPAPYQTALDNAKAALGRAEANLPAAKLRVQRFAELLPDKAVSQQDYDDASASLGQVQADVAYFKASVAAAQINLGYTAVKAPITGRIGKSNITEGAIVTAYQPLALASIQQLDPIFVDVSQSTAELLRLKNRLADGRLKQNGSNLRKVQLILEDNSIGSTEGTLQFRDVTVDATTGSVMLRISFPNPDLSLLPGMFVRALVKEGVKEDAMLIPQQSVVRDPKGNPMAMVIDADSKVAPAMLTVDRAIEDKWLISSGLKPGDRIVVEGIQKARPGTTVRIAQSGSDSPSPGNNPNPAKPDAPSK
jgi:membrane fusion protein (multidrug efflux system)